MNKIKNNVANFFKFDEKNATFKKEIIGGASTFLAMSYILAVNPSILQNANGGQNYAGVFFLGTAISACIVTMAMALYTNLPIALAPGMGVNAFFAYTVAGHVINLQVEQALVCTFISGILYAIIALTKMRSYIAKLLPKNIKLSIGVMIGLLLAYIGLNNSGIIVSDAFAVNNMVISNTRTKLGDFSDPFVIIAVITVILVFVLHFMKVKGAALIAMLVAIIMLAILAGTGVTDAQNVFTVGDYNTFNNFDELSKNMWLSFGKTLGNGKAYIAIFVFLYADFFDTSGTLFTLDQQANLSKMNSKWLKKANVVDAGGTIFGSIMLTSTTTSYIESSVGITQGAKTGFSSIIVSLLFGLSILAWPIMKPLMPISHIQSGTNAKVMPITGPILILVGALMFSQIKHFNWEKTIDIPVMFTIILIGVLGFSIASGMSSGIIIYYILNSIALLIQIIKSKKGKKLNINKEEIIFSSNAKIVQDVLPNLKKRILNPMMITLFILSVVYFGTMPLYT